MTANDPRAQSAATWLRDIAAMIRRPTSVAFCVEADAEKFSAIADALEAKDAEIARLKNSTTQARYAELEQARNHYFQQLAASRAENAALAKLVSELAELPNDARENWLGLADLKRRAVALRAGQQKGVECAHEWIDPSNEVVTAGDWRMCKQCGLLREGQQKGC